MAADRAEAKEKAAVVAAAAAEKREQKKRRRKKRRRSKVTFPGTNSVPGSVGKAHVCPNSKAFCEVLIFVFLPLKGPNFHQHQKTYFTKYGAFQKKILRRPRGRGRPGRRRPWGALAQQGLGKHPWLKKQRQQQRRPHAVAAGGGGGGGSQGEKGRVGGREQGQNNGVRILHVGLSREQLLLVLFSRILSWTWST